MQDKVSSKSPYGCNIQNRQEGIEEQLSMRRDLRLTTTHRIRIDDNTQALNGDDNERLSSLMAAKN